MRKSVLVFLFCLLLCHGTYSKTQWIKLHRKQTASSAVKYSPELQKDLKDFLDLIPKVAIDEVFAKHMFDRGFIKAINFLSGGGFQQLLKRIEQVPEAIEIINYLHLNDSALATPSLQLHNIEQTLDKQQTYSYQANAHSSEQDVVIVLLHLHQRGQTTVRPFQLHSFVSFAQELLTHLPRDRFVALINEKRKSGVVFPKFYEALRSQQFKPMVEAAMKSHNMASIISTLSSHEIDAQGMKGVAFDVISWGPN
ncbi:CG4398 [Drosophila busckii]|uniref:CG4398 n=1 Tax=Drosophila busckii TaxID=30019 RepID=A0A0M4EE85_DROBS|nr:uncharacterized protein LOC108595719 [Drosophila busckii]ALC41438.1 CG4398 [Drosophila busckii]